MKTKRIPESLAPSSGGRGLLFSPLLRTRRHAIPLPTTRNSNRAIGSAAGLFYRLKPLAFGLLLFHLSGSLTTPQASAQQIIWEKYWPNVTGQFTSLVQGDSGYFFGCGNLRLIRNFHLPIQQRDTLEGIMIVKLDHNGDTVWFKKIFARTSPPAGLDCFLVTQANGLLNLVFRSGLVPGKGLKVFTISQATGASFLSFEIPEFPSYPFGISKDANGSLYIIGEEFNPNIAGAYRMFCIRVDPNGQIAYQNGYSPGNHPASAAQYIEPMPGGKMRMSGNKGKTIVAYELNPDGTVADYKEFIDNPFGSVQQDGAYVQQAERGHFLVSNRRWSGSPQGNVKSLVRKIDSLGNVVWGGHKNYGGTTPSVTLDGGYLRVRGQSGQGFLERFGLDSNLIWSVNITQTQVNANKGKMELLYLGNNDGCVFGGIGNGLGSPYIAKIDNVGYPVDPANPVPPVLSVKEQTKQNPLSYAYPNPTSGIFHVLGMGTGFFKMTDAQGKTVLEGRYAGGDAIDVSHLPCGVYTYSLLTKDSRTEGRIIRN